MWFYSERKRFKRILITKLYLYLRIICLNELKYKLASLIKWDGFCSLKTTGTHNMTVLLTAMAQGLLSQPHGLYSGLYLAVEHHLQVIPDFFSYCV